MRRITILILLLATVAGCDAPDPLWPCGFGPCDGGGTEGDEPPPMVPDIAWQESPCHVLEQADLGIICAEASYHPGALRVGDGDIPVATYGPTGVFGLPEWTLPPVVLGQVGLTWIDGDAKGGFALDGLRADMAVSEALPEPSENVAAWVLADESVGCPMIRDVTNAIVPIDSEMTPIARVREGVIFCAFVPVVAYPIEYFVEGEPWGDWGHVFFDGRLLARSRSSSRSQIFTLDVPDPIPVRDYTHGVTVAAYAGWVGIRHADAADESG